MQIAPDHRVLFNGREIGPGGKVRGAAGTGAHAKEAQAAGLDAIRTWSLQQSRGALEAFKLGRHKLKVAAGIYLSTFKDKYEGEFCSLNHPWWQEQLQEILSNVTMHRNDPGLLWWQAGNELELQIDWAGGSECMWRRLEWVVRHIKIADPNHPVGTAIAGFHSAALAKLWQSLFRKLRRVVASLAIAVGSLKSFKSLFVHGLLEPKVKVGRLNTLCPSLDFLGLNVYGGDAYKIPQKLRSAGWTRLEQRNQSQKKHAQQLQLQLRF